MVIDNKKDERLTNFRLLVSWKAYKDLNLAKECDCMKKKFFVVIAIIVVIGNIL